MTLVVMSRDNDEVYADICSNASVWHTIVTSLISAVTSRQLRTREASFTAPFEGKVDERGIGNRKQGFGYAVFFRQGIQTAHKLTWLTKD